MDWKKFMLESNQIEREDRLNPGDEEAFHMARLGIDTEKEILKLHGILGAYLKENWVGKYREIDVRVGRYVAPSYWKVPALMAGYISKFSEMNAWEAHNEFERIHPFVDLNGRTGRLIWLSKAVDEGYMGTIPFLQAYYYQTLHEYEKGK